MHRNESVIRFSILNEIPKPSFFLKYWIKRFLTNHNYRYKNCFFPRSSFFFYKNAIFFQKLKVIRNILLHKNTVLLNEYFFH